MTDENPKPTTVELKGDPAEILDFGTDPDTPISVPLMVGSIALNMSMKYHDINVIKDGALYQQYKLEGKNMRDLNLDMVFETAKKIELHLMGTNQRLAAMVIEAVVLAAEDEEEEKSK